MPGPIPLALWHAYRRDVIATQPRRGPETISHEQREIKSGRLNVRLLTEGPETVGFILHPPPGRMGLQADRLYLASGHRGLSHLQAQMRKLVGDQPVLSMSGRHPGLSFRVVGRVLRQQGFRRVRRRHLALNLARARLPAVPEARVPVRALGPRDEKGIARLSARAYWGNIDSAFGPSGDVRRWAAPYVHGLFTARPKEIDYRCSFVATKGPRIIGDVIVSRWRGTWFIMDLAVDPRYRGGGIGRALLSRALHALAERRARRVELTVTEDNPTAAEALYREVGFRRVRGPARYPGIWIHEPTRRRFGLRLLGEA